MIKLILKESITIIALASCVSAFAQAHPTDAIQPASSQNSSAAPPRPSLIDSIKKSVVFLESDCLDYDVAGNQVIKTYSGTAFLLSMPDKRLGSDRGFTYLVTNRHVAQPGVEDGKPCAPFRYILRADLKEAKPDGSYSDIAFLPPSQLAWTYPANDSVDLAVTPIGPNQSRLDVSFIPSTLLMTAEDMKSNHVQEGDSVLFSGLFIQLIGQTHSEPIVREGKIAMIPREPVPTTLHKLGDLLLVDCHVFGGNSGSPMFIDLGGERNGAMILGSNYRLLGVVSGYMKESSDFSLQTVASYAGTMDANSGVATVVPAQDLLDLLNGPSLTKLRDEQVEKIESAPAGNGKP